MQPQERRKGSAMRSGIQPAAEKMRGRNRQKPAALARVLIFLLSCAAMTLGLGPGVKPLRVQSQSLASSEAMIVSSAAIKGGRSAVIIFQRTSKSTES